MDKAAKQAVQRLTGRTSEDYRNLFGRVTLEFGKTPAEVLLCPPISVFLRYDRGEAGSGIRASRFPTRSLSLDRLFTFRWLAGQSSGRLECLHGTPVAQRVLHSNKDFQMCYWPAELTGLSECHIPFFDFVAAQGAGLSEKYADGSRDGEAIP